jgi:hypothetical protein
MCPISNQEYKPSILTKNLNTKKPSVMLFYSREKFTLTYLGAVTNK